MSTEEQQIVTEEAPRAEKRAHKEIDENDDEAIIAAKTAKIDKEDKAENEVEEEDDGEEEEAGDNEESSTVVMTRVLIALLAIVAVASSQATAKPAAAATPKPAAAAAPKPPVAAAPKPPVAAAAGSMKCVQCASTKKGEENCVDSGDHLNKYTKVCPNLNEGAFKGNKAVGCRKIHQNIGDEKAIVRECAYSGENLDGQRKTGNSGIILFYYQCNETQTQPCNSVSSLSIFSTLLFSIAARFLA
ncbi:hypothetical protein PENTCL1PPCAC_26501 [Pristionchus entomophagus]|uniref:Uncharacterized protein n=1 Tax=Pristionchus entomophagus TaxID=358040 RepID=A0AAV5UBY4_9BILA|nr:hypothetical protein PENTCL1PPCAC_26501 [Pristionchus entomophagus]